MQIHHQVQLDRHAMLIDGVAVDTLDLAQERYELLMAMLRLERRGDLAGGDLSSAANNVVVPWRW